MADPKTVNLTIGERVAALKLFDAFKGSISQLSTLLEDVKQFTVSDEEWETAGLVKTPTVDGQGNPDGRENWKWNEVDKDGKPLTKEITLQEASLKYLKDDIQRLSDANEITIADVALVGLQKKLSE